MRRIPRPTATELCTLLGGGVVAWGAAVLVGWWTGMDVFATVHPAGEPMRTTTALSLVLLGLVLSSPPKRFPRAAGVATWAVLALSLVTLVEISASVDLRVDRLVPFVDLHGQDPRMATPTAVSLALLSAGTLLSPRRRGKQLARTAGGIALAVGYLASIGYLYGASELYTVRGSTSMALPTSAAITVLALVLLVRSERSTLDVLVTDTGSAGRLVRTLLPFLLAAPPALGWLALRGVHAGWFDTPFGTGVLVAAFTVATVALLLRTTVHVREADVERAVLLRRVVEVNSSLEAAVQTRTAELAATRARFAAAFASSPLGTALTTVEGVVEEVNRLLPILASSPCDDLVGHPIDVIFHDDRDTEERELRRELLAEGGGSYQLERRLARTDATCWVQVNVAAVVDDTGIRGLLYQLEDVTARKLAEDRAEHLALHDALTDLPNRVLLLDRLRQALRQSERSGRGVAVLFIDLDRFKVVNDSMGHHVGDALLVEVGRRLRRTARAADTVARIGGDEFVVVCPDVTDERDVMHVAEALRTVVLAPVELDGVITHVDASIGIALGTGHDEPDVLLRQADQAMYRAKDRGRARYEVFDDDLRARVTRRLDTELALRGAVERGEIETWYQPLVNLSDDSVVATEALVRWRRPGRGVVGPAEFVHVAEEVGLIKEIGTTVLRQACLAAAAMPDGPAVSVNVSPQQFVRADFSAVVEEALVLSGLSPHRLWLELTESAVVEAIDSAARSFQALRERGVRIAIDDFGTGFSSFSHLRDFHVDIVKIDRIFVRDLVDSPHDRAIVEGIVRMADALRLDVVAEGIETTSQRDLLRIFGCRYGQGFLYARPSPIAVPAIAPLIPGPRPAGQEVEQ